MEDMVIRKVDADCEQMFKEMELNEQWVKSDNDTTLQRTNAYTSILSRSVTCCIS